MNTDFKKSKALLEGGLAPLVESISSGQNLTLDDIQSRKEDLRSLLHLIDWRKMTTKITAREKVDAILAKQECESDSKFEAKYEAAVAAYRAIKTAEKKGENVETKTAETKSENADTKTAETKCAGDQPTTGDPSFDADYKVYLKLLPDATYGTNMAAKVKEATGKIEAIHSSVLCCLNKNGAATDQANQMVVEEVDTSSDVETGANIGVNTAKKAKTSEEISIATELLEYIFGADDPEVKRQKLEREQKLRELREAEEKLNSETRAQINANHDAQEAKIAEEKRSEEEKKREEEERELLEAARQKMIDEYDAAEMEKREDIWSKSDPDELLASVLSDMLRLSLSNFKFMVNLFHGLVETIVKRPEDLGGKLLRLENPQFKEHFIKLPSGCEPTGGLQFLYGLGFRKVDTIPDELHGQIRGNMGGGPFYFLTEPDPLEDMDEYEAFHERQHSTLDKLVSIQARIRTVDMQGSLDRRAADLLPDLQWETL